MFSSLYWEFAQKCLAFCFAKVVEFAKDLKVVACNFFQNSKQKNESSVHKCGLHHKSSINPLLQHQ